MPKMIHAQTRKALWFASEPDGDVGLHPGLSPTNAVRLVAGFLVVCVTMIAVGARAALPALKAISVEIDSTPAGSLRSEVVISPDGHDAWTLGVVVQNVADAEARLNHVRVRVPWLREVPSDLQLSLGASSMFDAPALVRAPGDEDLVSANYLQSRTADGRTQLAALLTWKTFRTKLRFDGGMVQIEAQGERRRVAPGESLSLEKLWFASDDHWQDVLFRYAKKLADENAIRRRAHPQWIGWSNWDYYGSNFTGQQVLDNARALAELNVGANLVQIDGGWWTKCGDYEPRETFPGGMKGMADAFRARGFVAGLHFDGARADADSQVVREHPEFFLKDQNGELIGGRTRADGRRGRVYFDFSHPGAREHYRQVYRRAREWGFRYFKVDFLKFALPEWALRAENRANDGTQIRRHDERLTSVEALRLALEAMRDGMGEDSYFLGCTADFGTVVGQVDALRSGGDIDPTYSRFSRSCMENGGAFYLHDTVFINDADYHVARGALDEDEFLVKNPRKTGGAMPFALAEMWTHYMGLFGGPKISGDNLLILRDERKDLFRRAVALPACERWVPLDFWQHARHRDDPFRALLGVSQGKVFLALFNWSEDAATIRVENFSGETARLARKLHGDGSLVAEERALSAALDGHSSVVIALDAGADFDEIRRALEVR